MTHAIIFRLGKYTTLEQLDHQFVHMYYLQDYPRVEVRRKVGGEAERKEGRKGEREKGGERAFIRKGDGKGEMAGT